MKKNFELEIVLVQLAEGNKKAIEVLYNYYYPRLYYFSKSFLKLEEGIDDILQEVFIKIWKNRKRITTPRTFDSFIYTITRNLLLNELRRRINKQKTKEKIGKLAIAEEFSLFEETEFLDLKEKIDYVINELPDRQKEIFILSRLNGLSHKEIAEKLAIQTKTVEYHIARATAFLKDKLKKYDLVTILLIFLLI